MGGRQYKRHKVEQGVAMVEFAITLPLLLLLLLVIGEFGRMLYQYNNLLQAGRDAGRFVAGKAWNRTLGRIDLTSDLQLPSAQQLVVMTKNVAVYGVPVEQPGNQVVPGLRAEDVAVLVEPGTTDHVRVSVTYTFRPVIGTVIPSFFGDPIPLAIPLQSTVVMRAL